MNSHKDINMANNAKITVKTGNFHCKNSSNFNPPKKPTKIVTTI